MLDVGQCMSRTRRICEHGHELNTVLSTVLQGALGVNTSLFAFRKPPYAATRIVDAFSRQSA